MENQLTNPKSQEDIVTIKLEKWSIKYLLGALRLGINAEDWCAGLTMTSINSYDTHSGKWIMRIAFLIDEIKRQTGEETEDMEYGECNSLNDIQLMVNKKCKEYCDYWEKAER